MPFIVKNTTIIGLLDLLAPHSCRGCGLTGYALCDRCKNYILEHRKNICPNCKNPNPTGFCPNCDELPTTYVIDERSNLIGELVHDYKYHSVRALARPLAELVDEALPDFDGSVTIVPLPTSSDHIRERGFDHTLHLARKLVKIRGSNYGVEKIIARSRNTVQVGTNRAKRLVQAQEAYRIDSGAKIDPSRTYLLLDDVWTTGASIRACLEKLRKAGAQRIVVVILALSRID